MMVSEWIRLHPRTPATVRQDQSLEMITDSMLSAAGRRDIYVQDETGRLIGHIGYVKLAQLLLAEHQPKPTRRQLIDRVTGGTAQQIMTRHFPSARQDEELDDVIYRQLDHHIEEMPVLDDAEVPIGVLNLTEVLVSVHTESKQL